jgi:hypothetical protein
MSVISEPIKRAHKTGTVHRVPKEIDGKRWGSRYMTKKTGAKIIRIEVTLSASFMV